MCTQIAKRVTALIVLCAVMSAVAGNAMAETILQVEAAGSGSHTIGDTTSGDPETVVTAILSQPGSVHGRNYSYWMYLVNDGTGSLGVFGTPTGYTTPVVGDTVKVAGTYSPYNQIPEMGTTTSAPTVTKMGGPATVPDPTAVTIPDISDPLDQNVAGYLLTLDNVTISGISGTFGTSNMTGTITDGSSNSMALYYWASSYSTAVANLYGMTIPTGPVNMTGIATVYGSTPEFVPMTITPVPEPGAVFLLASGVLCALMWSCWQPEIVALLSRKRVRQ